MRRRDTASAALVRDDFTLAITRFLEELEEPLLQNRNFATIDRFSPEHAAKVLEAFGRAYRRLGRGAIAREPAVHRPGDCRAGPRGPDGAGADRSAGRNRQGASLDRRHIAATRRGAGRERRIPRAAPGRRAEPPGNPAAFDAVRRLLRRCCLPTDENIRGPSKTRSELVAALGEAITPQRLDKLLLLLDVDVRLITPVRSATADSTSSDSSQREPAYQLTHDYLVSAIRAWLTANQRSSARPGQAAAGELAEAWNAAACRSGCRFPGMADDSLANAPRRVGAERAADYAECGAENWRADRQSSSARHY